MKKLTLTIAIVLGLSMTTFAEGNPGGGLFQRGASTEEMEYANRDVAMPVLPTHGLQNNYDATGPVGSGIAVLLGLGAAYLVGKRRKED